jgi:hypothetical protein
MPLMLDIPVRLPGDVRLSVALAGLQAADEAYSRPLVNSSGCI